MPLLVITRTLNKRLYIGDEIQIKVTKVDRGYVSLGITAPKHVPIVKSELYERPSDDDLIDSAGHA